KVRGRVARRLAAMTETEQHPQPVGVEREDRMAAAQQKDLVRPRRADARELHERLASLGQGELHGRLQASPELLERDRRRPPQLLQRVAGHDAPGDLEEQVAAGGKDLLGTRAYALLRG